MKQALAWCKHLQHHTKDKVQFIFIRLAYWFRRINEFFIYYSFKKNRLCPE